MRKTFSITYRSNKKATLPLHSHPEYEVYYFHEGKSNYLIGDKLYTLTPGDLIIMHGMTLHRPKLFEKEEYIRTVIHFNPEWARKWNEQMPDMDLLRPFNELRNHKIHLSKEERLTFEQMLAAIQQARSANMLGSEYRVQLRMLDLLIYVQYLFHSPLQKVSEFPSDKERNVQHIISYIENHYMEDLRLDTIERDLHFSKYYLSKIFKEVTGVTIFEFLYQRRLNQAKILLSMEKDLSITEVCQQVGFKHLAHFSRLFKAKVGQTPEQFKKHNMS